jgi:hypothetical protein
LATIPSAKARALLKIGAYSHGNSDILAQYLDDNLEAFRDFLSGRYDFQ